MSAALTIPAAAVPFIAAGKIGHGMTTRQIALLHVIAANPGSSVKPLAEAVGLGRPNVTMACTKLLELGLVKRATNPKDRRLVEMRVTAAGKRAVGAA